MSKQMQKRTRNCSTRPSMKLWNFYIRRLLLTERLLNCAYYRCTDTCFTLKKSWHPVSFIFHSKGTNDTWQRGTQKLTPRTTSYATGGFEITYFLWSEKRKRRFILSPRPLFSRAPDVAKRSVPRGVRLTGIEYRGVVQGTGAKEEREMRFIGSRGPSDVG